MNNGFHSAEIERLKNTSMVFVLGKARSGTSLLQLLLNAHPEIVAPFEAKFLMLLYPRFKQYKKWDEKTINDFVDALFHVWQFKVLWNSDRERLTQKLLAAKEHIDYALLCKLVYLEMAEDKTGIKWISDKNPLYTIFIRRILKVYPAAKFIHIVRNPYDNIYSNIKTYNIKKNKFHLFQACQWVGVNTVIEKEKKKMPERFYTIKYETLVQSPEAILKELCNFLNLQFSPQMLRPVISEASKSEQLKVILETTHKPLLGPMDASNIGKGKIEMKPYDRALVQKITGNFATVTYGYNMNSGTDEKIKISALKRWGGRLIYILWEKVTRFRYGNYRFNYFYSIRRKTPNEFI